MLRGVGGPHHGRSFTLDQPRLVGRAAECDIRIDDAAFADRHARLEPHADRRGAARPGFGTKAAWSTAGRCATRCCGRATRWCSTPHRFVVEAPVASDCGRPRRRPTSVDEAVDSRTSDEAAIRRRRVPVRSALRRLPLVAVRRRCCWPRRSARSCCSAVLRCPARCPVAQMLHIASPAACARMPAYSAGSRTSDFTSHQKCSTASTPMA